MFIAGQFLLAEEHKGSLAKPNLIKFHPGTLNQIFKKLFD